MTDIQPSVAYRTSSDRLGWPEARDYEEVIEQAKDGLAQLAPDGNHCNICGASGHQAMECHHSVLRLARKWVAATNVYRCFHCGFVATTDEEAVEHFGKSDEEVARCIAARSEQAGIGRGEHAANLIRLADVMRDCSRLISKSGLGEMQMRAAAQELSRLPDSLPPDVDGKAVAGPLLKLDSLLAALHAAAYDGALEEKAQDDCGNKEAKAIQRHVRDLLRSALRPTMSAEDFPRLTAWRYLGIHGQWPDVVPVWARDHRGLMNDSTVNNAVIEELVAAFQAPPAVRKEDALLNALRRIATEPVPEDSVHGPRLRCLGGCGHAWVIGKDAEHHGADCSVVIAREAIAAHLASNSAAHLGAGAVSTDTPQ
jgi:hypothetical protein